MARRQATVDLAGRNSLGHCPSHQVQDSTAHAVLLLDQTGWHVSTRLKVPSNITLLPLPAKAPELNPVENIWQYLIPIGVKADSFGVLKRAGV
jgi:DDE superfamily endonuclease